MSKCFHYLSYAGKVIIKHTAEVEALPKYNVKTRNGPAQQRRRERRAAARAAVAADEAVAVDAGEAANQQQEQVNPDAEEPRNSADDVEETLEAVNASEPKDEIVNEKISDEKSDQISHTVSIIPVRRVNANDETIEKVVKQKLAAKDVNVLELYIERSENGTFSRCDARVEPVKGKQIDETNFEFENCRVIPMFGGS